MADTATIDEPIVSQPETSALYLCKRSELKLVRVPEWPIYGAGGQQVGLHEGQAVQFSDGVLRVPREGKVVLADGREADAAEIVEWLDKHRLNGDREEGFWPLDPTAPPVSKDELKALMRAAATLNVEALETALAAEQDGWNRPDMVEAIEENLADVRGMLAEAEKVERERAEAETKAQAATLKKQQADAEKLAKNPPKA